MVDEYIKEITIAMIENKRLHLDGKDNEEMAKKVAEFINTLRKELNL